MSSTLLRKSSSNLILVVSAYALSERHTGHVAVCSDPTYHSSMQAWHPIIRLQYLANITGGLIGDLVQILHLNVSLRVFFKHLVSFVILKTASKPFFMLSTVTTILSNFAPMSRCHHFAFQYCVGEIQVGVKIAFITDHIA